MKVADRILSLQNLAVQTDDEANNNGKLASQEVANALSEGSLEKAEAKILQHAVSAAGSMPGGATLANVKKALGKVASAFETADINSDGKLSKAELKNAQVGFKGVLSVLNKIVESPAEELAKVKSAATLLESANLGQFLYSARTAANGKNYLEVHFGPDVEIEDTVEILAKVSKTLDAAGITDVAVVPDGEYPIADFLAVVGKKVELTRGGNEGEYAMASFEIQGDFKRVDNAVIENAFAEAIADYVASDSDSATDTELEVVPATQEVVSRWFSHDEESGAAAAKIMLDVASTLTDAKFVQLGKGDTGAHPVWLVGVDKSGDLVGLRGEVVWT
jgi:hypothetical protein